MKRNNKTQECERLVFKTGWNYHQLSRPGAYYFVTHKWKRRLVLLFTLTTCLFTSDFGQQVVVPYKIQNLISDVVLQKFEQINQEVEVYEHKEGNRLILIGDSLEVESALEQLELLDVPQMMVTIEFMLVEYFHEDDFEWGIDITQGSSGNFGNINYTPGSPGGQLSFDYSAITNLTPNFQFNLRALVSEDKAKVLTNPHLAVKSGATANLNIVDRRTIVLETATINGVTTTLQNIEAGIRLSVTPVPTHDSLIHMAINGVVSEFLPFSSAGEYLIEENDINTEVDVRNGQTLIIGGMILEETNKVDGGVPFLRKIPLLGLLFKTKRQVKNYVERVMYITSYIHPIENLAEYENIRQLTPFEKEVEEIIEGDPQFLKYERTKNSMEKSRKKRMKNRN
ncbi:MAG: type II and III secretion system protein [Phaeodactylibacter sp.]|nr:type II and III secretion system protein [Phaeodactylibacter sp.]MCB9289490.1 type II and III secretion system protein [Lewinellaceae bacterium]